MRTDNRLAGGIALAVSDTVTLQIGAMVVLFLVKVRELPEFAVMGLETLCGPALLMMFRPRSVMALFRDPTRRDLGVLGLLVLLSIGMNATMIICLAQAGVAMLTTLELVGSLAFTAVLESVKEQNFRKVPWTLLVALGVIGFVDPFAAGAPSLLAIGAGLLCGAGVGLRIWYGNHLETSENYAPQTVNTMKQAAAVISSGPLVAMAAMWSGGLSAGNAPMIEVIGLIIVAGVVNTALPQLLELAAARRISAHQIALITCSSPVLSAFLTWSAVALLDFGWMTTREVSVLQWLALAPIVIGAIGANQKKGMKIMFREMRIRWADARLKTADWMSEKLARALRRAKARAEYRHAKVGYLRARADLKDVCTSVTSGALADVPVEWTARDFQVVLESAQVAERRMRARNADRKRRVTR